MKFTVSLNFKLGRMRGSVELFAWHPPLGELGLKDYVDLVKRDYVSAPIEVRLIVSLTVGRDYIWLLKRQFRRRYLWEVTVDELAQLAYMVCPKARRRIAKALIDVVRVVEESRPRLTLRFCRQLKRGVKVALELLNGRSAWFASDYGEVIWLDLPFIIMVFYDRNSYSEGVEAVQFPRIPQFRYTLGSYVVAGYRVVEPIIVDQGEVYLVLLFKSISYLLDNLYYKLEREYRIGGIQVLECCSAKSAGIIGVISKKFVREVARKYEVRDVDSLLVTVLSEVLREVVLSLH